MSESPAHGAVLPLDPQRADLAEADPWRLLAEEQGLLVTWGEATGGEERWGPALRGASALGQQLQTIVTQAGQSRILTSGQTLFRVEVPTGSTLQDLVPAVGGGFRGMVRAGDKSALTGHARLVPVAGGTAAGVAIAPLVGLMALSVGSEMLARHQQDKKLDAIRRGVEALTTAAEETTRAQLESAEQALEQASAAILDRSDVPSAIGLGTARDNLRVIRNRGVRWMTEWEKRLDKAERGRTGIDFADMRTVLGGSEDDDTYLDFPNRVETIYRALTLDSRAIVLTNAEAALRRTDQTLGHLQEQLRRDLAKNAYEQERLRELLWNLTLDPVTFSRRAMPQTGRKVAELQRMLTGLTMAATRLPDAPPVLTSSNRQITEIVRDPKGTLRVLKPHDEVAADV